jgi:hypothetical protein
MEYVKSVAVPAEEAQRPGGQDFRIRSPGGDRTAAISTAPKNTTRVLSPAVATTSPWSNPWRQIAIAINAPAVTNAVGRATRAQSSQALGTAHAHRQKRADGQSIHPGRRDHVRCIVVPQKRSATRTTRAPTIEISHTRSSVRRFVINTTTGRTK